ncbi:hypothetical protein IAR55_007040 [Kwoniella newhampshirensis]|uniref:Protein CPL1-like domain-containing protein n=1 Tax=Kwoniella newhampshirensis TaxID=1651941 RepID=A0AAW0YS71_9TREE
MRLQYLSLPVILLLLPFVLSQDQVEAASFGAGDHSSCKDVTTRDPHTCQCLPGFNDPGKWGKECVCPDEPNTKLSYNWVHERSEACCVCTGHDQIYNTDAHRCECLPGFETYYDWHHRLHCKPAPSSSTGGPPQPSSSGGYLGQKRALNDALRRRDAGFDSRAVEETLGCKSDEKACEADDTWTCTDVTSSLSSCGGCPGDGIDCGALPGVSEVRCIQGICAIDTCHRGFVLEFKSHVDGPTSSGNITCAPKHHRPWFTAQGGDGL